MTLSLANSEEVVFSSISETEFVKKCKDDIDQEWTALTAVINFVLSFVMSSEKLKCTEYEKYTKSLWKTT